MEKLATQILDIRDDRTGIILKEYFNDFASIPDVIKQAEYIEDLSDDQYALVMLNNGDKYCKYPVNDIGNTMLSAMYLVKQAHLLPKEAAQTAAESITQACEKHKIETPQQIKDMVSELGSIPNVEVRLRERYWKSPQTLDTSKLEPSQMKEKKAAEHSIMDRYPVDTYEQVKLATDYFNDYWRHFEPAERFEYCQKLASRMEDLNISVPKEIERYGSPTYAYDLKLQIDHRKSMANPAFEEAYDTLYENRNQVQPTTFANTLEELDKVAGLQTKWDSKIYDPYKTTFGPSLDKLAEDKHDWCYNENGLYIDTDALYILATNKRHMVKKHLGEEFADKFNKDPVKSFESLSPRAQLILARMASNKYQN